MIMDRTEKVILVIVIAALVIFLVVGMPFMIHTAIQRNDRQKHWCESHGLVFEKYRLNLCYDSKTGLIYRPLVN